MVILISDKLFDLCVCPKCRSGLRHLPGTLSCESCGESYPMVGGVPVFTPPRKRVMRDAQIILDGYDDKSSSELREEYLSRVYKKQNIHRGIVEAHSFWSRISEKRGQQNLDLARIAIRSTGGEIRGGVAMDIGCGTGTVLQAMAGDFDKQIGVDPNLSDLIIARKVLEEKKVEDFLLLCCYAENLPIRDDVCDLAMALNAVEHFADQRQAIHEVVRVLSKGGHFFFDSKNRFDPFRLEPHVRLPLVGFLPRGLAKRYVKAIRGLEYDVRLLSRRELRSMLNDMLLNDHPSIHSYGISVRRPVYNPDFEYLLFWWDMGMKTPILGKLLEIFAPTYDIVITE